MKDLQRFESRERRAARMLLALVGSQSTRILVALLTVAVGGFAYAKLVHTQIAWFPEPPFLENPPTTSYISRYLGRPDVEPYLEADPTLAPSQPNTDHFYRTVAARAKKLVGDPRTKYFACVVASNGVLARGWPFMSRRPSYSVDVWEEVRFDGRPVKYHSFVIAEDGLDPERPQGWWGNAAFGGILSGVVLYTILTLVARGLQRSMRPVAGFPVIVPDQSTVRP